MFASKFTRALLASVAVVVVTACSGESTAPLGAAPEGIANVRKVSGVYADSVAITGQGTNPRCTTTQGQRDGLGFIGGTDDQFTVANQTYTVNVPGLGSITYTTNSSNTGIASWTSTFPIDAVVMKGGSQGAQVYFYSGATDGQPVTLFTPDNSNELPAEISHLNFCWYGRVGVSLAGDASYTRTHNWSIAKSASAPASVTTGSPIVVSYTVSVDESSIDSDWAIAGAVRLTNSGYAAAGTVSGVSVDVGGTAATVTCWNSQLAEVSFPYTMQDNEQLRCQYTASVSDASTRTVVASITAEAPFAGSSGSAAVEFGEPTSEIDTSVSVSDDRYTLAPGTATSDYTWNYTLAYGPYVACTPVQLPTNTASYITNDNGLSGSATAGGMTVNVTGCTTGEAEELGTGFAFGNGASTFSTLSNGAIRRWGWSLAIAAPGSYTYDVYVGAGQNDLNKGTKVGTVTITYTGSAVTAAYNLDAGYVAMQQHLYAGGSALPNVCKGKTCSPSVAPGQFTVATNLTGGPIWVIAHAVIGYIQQ
ncbi:MAG: hypothetical protein ACYC5V_15050 [Gemmatimonadaceae bacterium]